jgi:hypothetical protein
MPIYSRKEYAEMCGMTGGNLSNYIKRGKVIPNEDGHIDSNDFVNAEFLALRQHKRAEFLDKKKPVAKKPKSKKPETAPEAAEQTTNTKVTNARLEELREIDEASKLAAKQARLKIELQNEKLETEIRLKRLAVDKAEGKVIPVELVENIITEQSDAGKVAFANGIESLIVRIAAKKELTGEERSFIKEYMTPIINTALQEQHDIAHKRLSEIVEHYSSSAAKSQGKI